MREWWPRPEIIVPIFIARTCLMNSSAPLMKSILMDYVSKRNRAKWASLDSVARFGWSGSAVAGGELVQFNLQVAVLDARTVAVNR